MAVNYLFGNQVTYDVILILKMLIITLMDEMRSIVLENQRFVSEEISKNFPIYGLFGPQSLR